MLPPPLSPSSCEDGGGHELTGSEIAVAVVIALAQTPSLEIFSAFSGHGI